MPDRVILHCDCNSFYASVETAMCPEYRNVPMAVCGSTEDRHGIVLAKNELAKRYKSMGILNDEIDITELRLPTHIQNLSIKDMDIRKNYNLNIIAIKRGDDISTEITPDLVLNGDDVIVVIGKNLNIKKFENYLNS